MTDDGKLWADLAKDDYGAFDRIVERYYSALLSFSFGITRRYDKSEDIVQELFVNLWEARRRNRERTSLRDYLYRAARNRSLNYLRTEMRQRNMRQKIEVQEENLWRTILDEEVRRLLRLAIDSLDPRQREVITLTLDGVKQEKIAEQLGISLRTVKSVKAESVDAIRKALDEDRSGIGRAPAGKAVLSVLLSL